MCIPLFEKEEEENDQRFPGDTPSYRKWEDEYRRKHGKSHDYNGEP
jgi:hypothetical protein